MTSLPVLYFQSGQHCEIAWKEKIENSELRNIFVNQGRYCFFFFFFFYQAVHLTICEASLYQKHFLHFENVPNRFSLIIPSPPKGNTWFRGLPQQSHGGKKLLAGVVFCPPMESMTPYFWVRESPNKVLRFF